MSSRLPRRATIGVLGGGQLGRMLCAAASRLEFRTHVFAPPGDLIAGQVANQTTAAEYTDTAALQQFGESVDVITYEFENVPAETLDLLEGHCAIWPPRDALAVSQDRLVEKEFLQSIGIATAPFADVDSESSLIDALTQIGVPSVLKTRRFGYDGKGQVWIRDPSSAAGAWSSVGNDACVLEQAVELRCEVSVIAARSPDADVKWFDPGENVHVDGILRTTTVPAQIDADLHSQAVDMAQRILDALEYVGVLGVELFVTPDGLLVNEIAPRVHNSGHWTQNGCAVDQFEQHIRAIANWPLGAASRHSDVVMHNLIGDEILQAEELARDPAVALHLYGKEEWRPGRKMGHYNRIVSR